ncbi:phosphodiester glycosidase family protein [Sphingobacterium thermophilum]|uniref:Phosphodiester glycosidase family protein n=1 Tax=Sphingobacterium thermophilum TaxID=768534 RepID=A0ABP8R5X2_9SPHI
MKNITAFFLYLILPLTTYCQQLVSNNDSATFTNFSWQNEHIAKGVVWRSGHFNSLFNSKQFISILEIDLSKRNKKLGIVALPQQLEHTSTLARHAKALAAINGGFFHMKNGGAVNYIKVKGKVITYSKSKGTHANAFFAFDRKKTIITSDSVAATALPNVMLAGPLLLENNRTVSLADNAFNKNRHPRTGVGLAGNKLYLITVDGRNSMSQGFSLAEFTNIFRWLGCTDAMNLDGGGSTAMYIEGKGIVNHPSDNKKFDHQGERKVANIIYIKK